jgi:hypothetical protein
VTNFKLTKKIAAFGSACIDRGNLEAVGATEGCDLFRQTLKHIDIPRYKLDAFFTFHPV